MAGKDSVTINDLTRFKGTGNAGITDIELYLRAGIDPKTGMPTRGSGSKLLGDIRKVIRIIDEQDAVNRFNWSDLPTSIDSQQLERLLYYKGQLLFFKYNDKYYFMPYTLDGTIDFYGRYNQVHPIPMTSGVDENKEKETASFKNIQSLLSSLKIKPIYDENEISDENIGQENFGVILRDYTNQLSQEILPRWQLNDCITTLEAECMCYLNTALILGTGISGVRVPDADSMEQVKKGAMGLKTYAISGLPWVPIKGTIEFQELTESQSNGVQDYFLALQSIDNFRLSTYGLDNSGVFEKQSHILNEENQINQQKYHFVLMDSFKIREKFTKIANKLFGLNIKVEIAEDIAGTIGGDTTAKNMVQYINKGDNDYGNEE